tara:strand:- start:992 stop:1276 length:285 start_codon:yes stop_codon:yes gene_type:complete
MTEQDIIKDFKDFLNKLSVTNSIKHNYSDKKGLIRAEAFTRYFAEKIKFFDKEISKKGNELIKNSDSDVDSSKLNGKLVDLSKGMINKFKSENQ